MSYQKTIFPQGVSLPSSGGGAVSSVNGQTGAVILQPTIPTYYINKSGSNFQAIDANGNVARSSANGDVVCNYAITQCNNLGNIFCAPNTTFTITATLTITGLGTDVNAPVTMLNFWGSGFSTIFNVTASATDCFTISNGAHVNMQNLKILEPDSNSGNGIFGVDTGTVQESVQNSFFNNIMVVGCDSSHACIWLKNPFLSDFGTLIVDSVNGNGIIFDATDPNIHIGNCHVNHIQCGEMPSAKYVLTLQALIQNAWINLVKVEQIEADMSGGCLQLLTNQTNGYGNVTNNWFYGLDMETTDAIFINVVGSNSNYFKGFLSLENTNQTAFNVVHNSVNDINSTGNIFDFDIGLGNNGSTTIIVNERSDFYAFAVNEYILRIMNWSDPLTTNQFVFGAAIPKVTWKSADSGTGSLKNPNTVVKANVADGGTISHAVGLIPTWVVVSGDGSSAVNIVTELASARTDTACTIQIKTPAGLAGANQTVTLRAGWHSD